MTHINHDLIYQGEEKAIKTYHMKKIHQLHLLNYEFTVVNHVFWKAEFSFTSHSQLLRKGTQRLVLEE